MFYGNDPRIVKTRKTFIFSNIIIVSNTLKIRIFVDLTQSINGFVGKSWEGFC